VGVSPVVPWNSNRTALVLSSNDLSVWDGDGSNSDNGNGDGVCGFVFRVCATVIFTGTVDTTLGVTGAATSGEDGRWGGDVEFGSSSFSRFWRTFLLPLVGPLSRLSIFFSSGAVRMSTCVLSTAKVTHA
jgi:hypothetical protein